MTEDAGKKRQRGVMASDTEWELSGRLADERGMDRSAFLMSRALMPDALPAEVMRRAVRELLVLSLLEERRLREGGAGHMWDDVCDAVDAWLDREGMLARLTDPGAANRWKAVGRDLDGDEPGTSPRNGSGAG